ncbi:hypothetical protein W02_16570 [Nitrospira sp. KM1]|uniref:hypothetical protein n=1 Tax=Nitrospira sp. KM1 TaxID=1936990 RepID=UPI0013A723B3|nr:hypothetical protein [Nitrospira sp. KM1]BCA54517.1 hypothetical protein W02_16570 [Nitrospira sp. KM1]
MFREEIATGQHRRPQNWNVLTTAFVHHPTGLAQEPTDVGLHHMVTLGIPESGVARAGLRAALAESDKARDPHGNCASD